MDFRICELYLNFGVCGDWIKKEKKTAVFFSFFFAIMLKAVASAFALHWLWFYFALDKKCNTLNVFASKTELSFFCNTTSCKLTNTLDTIYDGAK